MDDEFVKRYWLEYKRRWKPTLERWEKEDTERNNQQLLSFVFSIFFIVKAIEYIF